MGKFRTYIKSNWEDASKWLLGALFGLVLTKTCDRIWPDPPAVIKEVSDTVKFVHSFSPMSQESDSLLKEQIQQQLLALELLQKYEATVQKQKKEPQSPSPCKMIFGNPYPNSKGYVQKSASAMCQILLERNDPFIDVTFHFIRDEYLNSVSTLEIKVITKRSNDGNGVLILDHSFEPQNSGESLIRIVDNFSPGEYSIVAGFYLKEETKAQYPSFYSQSFNFKK